MRSIFTRRWLVGLLLGGSLTVVGCVDTDNDGVPDDKDLCPETEGLEDFDGCPDGDGDSFTSVTGDCNDFDASVFPGAFEACDGVDNNCNRLIDELDDKDQDGEPGASCAGDDCNDLDASTFPGAPELTDDLDNDCDGVVDNDTVDRDDDGDCFCDLAAGQCNGGSVNNDDADPANDCPAIQPGDCDDAADDLNADGIRDGALFSPSSIEVAGDAVDSDCDGNFEPVPCQEDNLNQSDPFSFAKAIGLCHNEVISAQFIGGTPAISRAIVPSYGVLDPFAGTHMVIMSTGNAASTDDHVFNDADLGTTFTHPSPNFTPPANGCGGADENIVNDYTELRLQIKVPANARGFSYKLQFLSGEYINFRCDNFDDTFLALLTSQNFSGNISFDTNGNVISINNGFMQICDESFDNNGDGDFNDIAQGDNQCIRTTQDIAGTGYEGHGATLPLTTTVPSVVPGEILTLRFAIYDETDHILDSSIIIDGWEWLAEGCEDDPATPVNECNPNTIP